MISKIYTILLFVRFHADGIEIPSYHAECLQFPKINPLSHPNYEEEVKFDPKIHLALDEPETITTTQFNTVPYPIFGKDYDIAFSAPTRVFTEEGVRVLRSLIDRHRDKSMQNPRTHRNMRGMAYWSKFIRDFSYDKTWLSYVSRLANKPLCPQTINMHTVQINIGEVGMVMDVDKWHLDSVDYVMVVILSDVKNMTGGELQVYKNVLNGREDTEKAKVHGVHSKYIANVSYANSGYGIFCQGSKIMHRVTPVTKAAEPRISFIASFTATDPFEIDNTRTVRFTKDPENIVSWEYARHAAWRINNQMKYVIDKSNPDEFSGQDLANLLNNAAEKLRYSAKVVTNQVDDAISWVEEKVDIKSKKEL